MYYRLLTANLPQSMRSTDYEAPFFSSDYIVRLTIIHFIIIVSTTMKKKKKKKNNNNNNNKLFLDIDLDLCNMFWLEEQFNNPFFWGVGDRYFEAV